MRTADASLSHGDCGSPGKRPLVDWQEFQERLPTETEAADWWGKWPEANISMVTGPISGVSVIDIDGVEGKEAYSRYGENQKACRHGRKNALISRLLRALALGGTRQERRASHETNTESFDTDEGRVSAGGVVPGSKAIQANLK